MIDSVFVTMVSHSSLNELWVKTNIKVVTLSEADTVRLTPIGNLVRGYQEFLVAPNETIVGLVKKIRSSNWGMVRR